jgi:hypothetical protein
MDLVFRQGSVLQRLYPQLVHLAMTSFSRPDVLRFMSKQVTLPGTVKGHVLQPVSSDYKVRPVGVRGKHRFGANSLQIYEKAYDELGAVLRPEVTVIDTHRFRVFRPKNDEPQSEPKWRPMARDLADLRRRAEECQKVLDRYTDALAAVDDTTTLHELTAELECRRRWRRKPVRPIHPFEADDHALLSAVHRGQFALNGFRNRDLQAILYSTPAAGQAEQPRCSVAITRKLRMLRAHGVIRKLPNTHRYSVSLKAHITLNSILTAHRLTAQQLAAAA